jgi:OFA family oxalate/formate antiporter-like MFS transporter
MSERASVTAPTGRWVQLWLGVLCMVLIANLQYAWTLFVDPMHQAHGWTIAEIQIAFSIFIATETWLPRSKATSSIGSDRQSARV